MLKKRIEDDLKEALKNKDSAKVSTLRFLKAALQNAEIEKREELKDEDVISIIKRQLKQRKDSIDGFEKGGRKDLVEKETKELEILKTYLPEELGEEALVEIIRKAITEVNATSMKDMGQVMKQAMVEIKGRADGKIVSDLVRKELSKGESR